jgi:hypothetical protein
MMLGVAIENAARVDEKLELQVKPVEHGLMSAILFSETKENDLYSKNLLAILLIS